MSVLDEVRVFGELQRSSLGADPRRLEAAWKDNGYLYFPHALERGAVLELYGHVMDAYESNGLACRGDDGPLWNGGSITDEPQTLMASGACQGFCRTPAMVDFVTAVFGAEPTFLENSGVTFLHPGCEPARPHQDGTYLALEGFPFRTFWVPLCDIDAELGGLAISAGSHRRGWLSDFASVLADESITRRDIDEMHGYPLIDDAVPAASWCRADYRVGDVLVFHPHTLHGGLPNRSTSGRIRLSVDFRALPAAMPRPAALARQRGGVVDFFFNGVRTLIREGAREADLHAIYSKAYTHDLDLGDPAVARRLIAEHERAATAVIP